MSLNEDPLVALLKAENELNFAQNDIRVLRHEISTEVNRAICSMQCDECHLNILARGAEERSYSILSYPIRFEGWATFYRRLLVGEKARGRSEPGELLAAEHKF